MAISRKPVVAWMTPQTQLVDASGNLTWTGIKWFQGIQQVVNAAFDQAGTFEGNLGPDTKLNPRNVPLLVILQNLDDTGVVTADGIDFARPYLHKDTDHIADGTGFPLAGGKVAFAAMVGSGPTAGQILVFDGAHWLPHAKATGIPKAVHKWLDSYNDVTGTFTQSQPAYTDLLGLPTLPVDAPATSHQWLNSYTAATGLFTETQPAFTDISGVATPAQIGTGTPAAGEYVDGATGAWTPLPGGGGGVSSVALTVPAEFSVSGSPVTSSGTLAVTKANQSANLVYAGPSTGSPAAPTFRAIAPADLPLASSSAFGAVKVDGTTITASGGVISSAGGSAITALTGDVTASGPGSAAATLAASGVTAGTYTNPTVTYDAKGRATAASNGSSSGQFFGNASAVATDGQNVITLGSTPVAGSVSILLRGVLLPISLISISGAVATYAGAFAAGDTITAQWTTTNSTPGGIALSSTTATFRGTGRTQTSTGAVLSLTWPAGTTVGDLAIVCVASVNGITSPSGWAVNNSVGGFPWFGAIFSRVLTSSDISTGSVTLTLGGTSGGVATIITFVGAPVIREVDYVIGSGTLPVTVSTSGAVLNSDTAIYFGSMNTTSVVTAAVNRGTLQQSVNNGNNNSAALYTEYISVSGVNSAIFSYSAGASFNYQAIVVVATTPGGAGTTPEIAQSQIIGLPATLATKFDTVTSVGTSGPATSSGTVINIPNYGAGSGSGFSPYPTAGLSPPISTNFTWLNQGTASATDKTGRMVVQMPDSFSAVVGRFLVSTAAIPAAPYTITLGGMISASASGNGIQLGIGLYDSSNNSVAFSLFPSGTALPVASRQLWTSAGVSGAATSKGVTFAGSALFFVRITDDGTNRKFYYSANGLDFTLFASEASNTSVVPTHAGIHFYNNGGGIGGVAVISIYHYVINNSILPQFN